MLQHLNDYCGVRKYGIICVAISMHILLHQTMIDRHAKMDYHE